jgi:hypothetical protein
MPTVNVTSRRQAEEILIQKAHRDPAFRRRLFERPGDTIFSELGLRIPRDVVITVVEESPRHVFLVIPSPEAAEAAGELSERELASVAGGLQEEAEEAAEAEKDSWKKLKGYLGT